MKTQTQFKTVRAVGRPNKDSAVKWGKVAIMWKHNKDRKIAEYLGVSIPAVNVKRHALIAQGLDVAYRPSKSQSKKTLKK